MPAMLHLHFLGNKNDSVDLNFFRMMADRFILLFLTLTSDANILILVVKCVNIHIYIYVHLYFHMHIYIYIIILINNMYIINYINYLLWMYINVYNTCILMYINTSFGSLFKCHIIREAFFEPTTSLNVTHFYPSTFFLLFCFSAGGILTLVEKFIVFF